MLSVVELSDVNGQPQAKLVLPSGLRVGDPVALKFTLQRQMNGGRHEILEVDHRFRITALGVDASSWPSRQLLSLDSIGKPPTWRSVKKQPHEARRLGPTHFDRTPIK